MLTPTVQWEREPHILILDDEQANVALLTRLLARAGFTSVTSSTDARRAVTLYRSCRPDLVLLDLHMPEFDGFYVLEALSLVVPATDYLPILVLTGDGNVEAKQRALSMGAKDFVAKPFDVAEVVLRIRNLLQTRLLHLTLQQQNGMLERTVEHRTWELEEARFDTLQRLALAAELRDDATGQHTRRVGRLSAAIATTLGLGSGMTELLERTAPLHDIGKIGIPDSVLLKPAGLSPDELQVMRAHTTIGARILAGGQSLLLRTAEQIAHCHHERWDGNGYPRQVAGDEIPLAARIVSVADVTDALSSDRPYRAAFTRAQAISKIEGGRGTQFDPAVVSALHAIDWEAALAGPDDGRQASDGAGANGAVANGAGPSARCAA